MRRIAASLVEKRTDIIEIDDVTSSYTGNISKIITEDKDIFSKPIDPAFQSRKIKNQLSKINKKYIAPQYDSGKSGTGSKYVDPEIVNGYGMFDLVQPPYNLEILASLYEESATHNASILARTMNTVALGYRWEDTSKSRKRVEKASGKNSDTLARLRDELQREEDRLNDLFDSFNIDESFIESLIKVWVDYLTIGNGYLEIGRNRNGSIGYIGHIPATHIRIRRARDGFVQRSAARFIFFRNFQDMDTKDPIGSDPNPNEIIHFRQYSPTNTYYGIPSAVGALSAIIGDKFAKEYNIDYFENKSIPRYAIILKGANLSQKSKTEIVNYFKNEIKGNNHGTLFIPLPATLGRDVDIKFEKLENTIQDSSFDKYRKANRDEITVANRVPAPKIGIYDNANLAVSRDADKTFKNQVVGPDQKILEKKINRIVQEFSDKKVFKFDEIDVIDEDLRSRIWDRYLRTEVMTPNEVRLKVGLTALEEGDIVLPYPTKITQEKNRFDMGQVMVGGKQTPKAEGAPVGNSNSAAGSPPKGSQDSAAGESSPADATTGRAERGSKQDSNPPV
jgi:PBSX family phage portal protein